MIKKINLKRLEIALIFMGILLVLPLVSAEDRCCKQNNADVLCLEYDINEIDNYCDSANIHLGLCEEISDCELGCCVDDEGLCASNSRKIKCSTGGGEWDGDDSCNINECQTGCCSFGGQAFFTTEKNCEVRAGFFGIADIDFQYGILEEECILSVQAEESGACVLSENNCIFTKEVNCITKGGEFYADYLCSNSKLNTSCEKQTDTKCVEGKDEVYWFDSCGNKENIYDMDKDRSWNNGKILSKLNSCILGSRNLRDCGNCDYTKNSICGLYRLGADTEPSEGDYTCRDLSCDVEIYGESVTKQNGESWCVYDGGVSIEENVSYSKSPVGSRHWKHVCIKGEERIESCSDYRNEICVQADVNNNGTIYSNAQCIPNGWWNCLDLNSEDRRENLKKPISEACNENPFCFYKPGSFFPGMCLPRYAPGFDLREESNDNTRAEEICDIGSSTCVVVYTRDHYADDYKCEVNCHCEEAGYAKEANDYCVSLGDCGAYVNYVNEFNDEGFSITGTPGLSNSNENDYVADSVPIFGDNIDGVKFRNLLRIGREGELDLFDILSVLGKRGPYDFTSEISPFPFEFSIAEMIGGNLFEKFSQEFQRSIGADSEKKYVKSTCMPYQPKDGGDDCELCNGDPMKPCSVYRCESLGKNCEFINKGTGQELCVDNDPDDKTAPGISFLEQELSDYLSYEKTSEGVKIIDPSDEGGCITAFTEFSLGIQTDEIALCKINEISTVYDPDLDGMKEFFGGNFLEINHIINTSIQSIESLAYQYEVFTGNIEEIYGNLRYYIRCKDVNGNSNFNEYVIDMCVKPGPDLTPPFIKKMEPLSESYVKYNQTEEELLIWVNEPADCKYGLENKEYNEMENEMNCFKEWDAKQTDGWLCTDTLSFSPENSSFYIKCKDQPWLGEDNESRNTMGGQAYNLVVSSSELSIVDFTPRSGEEIIEGVEPVTIELDVKTAGGAEDGKAICWYNFLDNENYNIFLDTASVYHKQKFSSVMKGDYNINLRCVDIAGNTAEDSTSFEVKLDTTGPKIVRMYYDGGLKIYTNEEAECRYSFDKEFKWENSTIMGGMGFEHIADWRLQTYYIQCADLYERKGGKKKIRTYNLI